MQRYLSRSGLSPYVALERFGLGRLGLDRGDVDWVALEWAALDWMLPPILQAAVPSPIDLPATVVERLTPLTTIPIGSGWHNDTTNPR